MQYVWGFLLLLIPCYVLYLYHSTLLTKTVRATVRMMGLLLVIGFLLYEVMALNQWGITLLFALLMVTIGAILTVRRAKLSIRQLFVPVMAGTLTGVLVVGLYVLWLVVGVKKSTGSSLPYSCCRFVDGAFDTSEQSGIAHLFHGIASSQSTLPLSIREWHETFSGSWLFVSTHHRASSAS